MVQVFKLKVVATMPMSKAVGKWIVFPIIDIVNAVSIESSISAHLSRLLQNETNTCVRSDLDVYSRLEGTHALEQCQAKLATSNDSAAANHSGLRKLETRLNSGLSRLKHPFCLQVQYWRWGKILTDRTSSVRSKQFTSMSQLLLEFASRLRLIACPFIYLILSGCSALDFTSVRPSSGSELLKFSNQQFSVEAVGTDEPNDIVAHVKVPLQMRSKFVLRRTTQSSGLQQVLDMGATESFTDYHLQSLETYVYELGSFDNGKFVPVIVRSLTIPHDFVVKGYTELPVQADHKFQPFRIFIRDRGVLVTSGQNVKIETSEIISDNGTITSFVTDRPAPMNVRGRSGGTLYISASKVTGHLNIVVRGETGGSGTPGADGSDPDSLGSGWTAGTAGLQGAPGGNSGMLHIHIPALDAANINCSAQPGLGGSGGTGGRDGQGHGGNSAANGPRGYDGQVDPQTEDWK